MKVRLSTLIALVLGALIVSLAGLGALASEAVDGRIPIPNTEVLPFLGSTPPGQSDEDGAVTEAARYFAEELERMNRSLRRQGASNLHLTDVLTMTASVKLLGEPENQPVLSYTEGTWKPAMGLDTDSGGRTRCAVYTAAGSHVFALSPSPAPVGEWLDLACTYDGGTLALYVDGELVATQSFGGPLRVDEGASWRIGEDPGAGTRLRDALVDDVNIWDRALDAVEIQNLHETSK